jgi:mannose-1-phosphate guanylyltransferase
MLEAGLRVYGHVATGYWSDLGTPSRYLATQKDLLFGQVPLQAFGESDPFLGRTRTQAGWIAPGVEARIAGPAFVEPGAHVHAGARLGSAVYVASDAVVEDGARLNRVTVFPGTRVRAGEELVDCLAWGDERVPAA